MPITFSPLPYTPIPTPRPFPIPAPYAPAQGIPQFLPGGPNWASGGGVQVGSYVPPFRYQPIPPTGAASFPRPDVTVRSPLPRGLPRVPSSAINAWADSGFDASMDPWDPIEARQSSRPSISAQQAQAQAATPPSGSPPPRPSASGGAASSARVAPPSSNLPPPPNLPDPPLYGPPPLAPARSSILPSWATKNLGGGKVGASLQAAGTTIGTNLALGMFNEDDGYDYTSTPLGRIVGATRRGLGYGSVFGAPGAIVGGLGAGLGQGVMEAGHAIAPTPVGEAFMEQGRQGAALRQSDSLVDKARGWSDLAFNPTALPGQVIGGFLSDFGNRNLEETNVGNVGSDSGQAQAQAQTVQDAFEAEQRRIAEDQRRARVEASSPENLEYMLNRLPMTPQSRSEITNEYMSQLAVMDEMYRSGGLTVPERVEERDGKMYVGDREVSKEQVQSVKNGDQEVKVVYRQANDDDLDDMQVDLYQRIVQSVPEVVAADREQTAQMNRMLGYSTALQYALEPYQAQAQQLGASYQQAAGSNPLLAPFAQAFQIGQQGIPDAYGAQAAVLPYQVMLEQQAKAQAAQAEQDALLARQKEIERYKKELGASSYQSSSSGSDALGGLDLGG